MLKAFLSYSTVDKEFVRQVASRLGRARIVFDEISFAPGEDFRESIQKGLDNSRLLVFFASSASLKSVWCNYELDEADWRELQRKLERHIVFAIDHNLTIAELPGWLRKGKVIFSRRPTQVVRDIEEILFSMAPEEIKKPFLGRQRHLEDATRLLSDLRAQPRLFVISGLDGIGRRTLLTRLCRDVLSQVVGPYFFWDSTKDLGDLYLWLLSETTELLPRSQVVKEVAAFRALSESQQIANLANHLAVICKDGAVPGFIDEGGMLDENGLLRPCVEQLVVTLLASDALYSIALIHRRNVRIDGKLAEQSLRIRVPPLSDEDTGLLLQQLLRRLGVAATADAINDIAPFLGGYPPSAYFCASFCKEYGVENLRADKSSLVDFKAKRFSKFLAELQLNEDDWRMFRYLAAEQPINLEGLAIACDFALDKAALGVRKLADLSLVTIVDERIAVAAPIRDAVHRAKGFLDTGFYADVARRLTAAFWEGEATPNVEVIDATLNAVSRGGSKNFGAYENIVQASTVHRLALENYHRKEYELAHAYANRALAMAPDRREVRRILFKALVQLEKWPEAERVLSTIAESGDRQQFYLRGFLEKKRRHPLKAASAFDAALKSGDTAISVYRDYGDVLFRLGRYDEAVNMIQKALSKDSENIFILDLIVRVLTEKRDFAGAETSLKELARFDLDRRFVHHRQSVLYAAKGNWDAALNEAEVARGLGYAPFEAFSQYIDGLIETKKFGPAWTELQALESRYGGQRKDVQIGLRCKLLTREGKWREALAAWDRLLDKTRPVHQALLRRVLEMKLKDGSLTIVDRQETEQRLAGLAGDPLVQPVAVELEADESASDELD